MAATQQLMLATKPVATTTEFVTGVTAFGTSRTDDGGESGFAFTVGASNVVIKTLGRWTLAGNSGSHTIRLCSGTVGGLPTTLGSVTVNTSGATAAQILSATLTVPVTALAGVQYFVFCTTSGGDAWYDNTGTTTVSTTAVATCDGMYYIDTTITAAVATTNRNFGPLSFGY